MKTELISYLFLSYLTLLVSGQLQFTTCPSSVCLSQPVTYECNSGADSLTWIVLDTNGDRVGDIVPYTGFSAVGATDSIDGQFNTVLINNTNPLGANITFTPTLSMNNYTVQCAAASGTLVNCSIVIADIPPAPIPGNITFYSDRLHFSWSPSTSPCLSHYNVNVTSIEYTISTNDTSLSLPVPSTNDTEYSISVVAVDTGGRYMSSKGMRMFTPDVPPAVNDFAVNQTYLDDDDEDIDDDIVNITVSWNEPLSSYRPNVSNYLIYHNVPDLDNITILAPTTTYNAPDATVGSVYTVGVAAVNVLGVGPIVSATISISSIVVPTTTSVLSSNIIVTPSTSPTPTDENTAGGLDSTVYIGIGAGVAVIVIVILIILIIIGYLIWCKLWKGKQENTADTVIYDTIPMDTPTNTVPNVPVTMNAPTDTVQVPGIPVSMNTAYGTATGVVHTTQNVAYTRSTGNAN